MAESNTIKDIHTGFDELLAICNLEHLKICMCQKDILRKFYKKYYIHHVINILKIADRNGATLDEKERLKVVGIDRAKEAAFSETARYCVTNNIRCPLEKLEIIKTLKIFDAKYVLTDPRVFIVLRSVLNHQLSSYRMQKYSNEHGICQTHYDREGNRSFVLNPVENAKRKFDEAMVQAIAVLNNMIEGQKVNLNYDVVDADELFGKLQDKEEKVVLGVIE